MNPPFSRVLSGAVRLLAALALLPALAHAQAWPAKPVRLVIPFAAGGATDTATRVVAEQLSKDLGQQFVVENRPGANGAIAGEFVARSAPDGYTLFAATNTPLAVAPFLMKKLPYDPLRDFTPVARMTIVPYVLVVAPDVPAANLKELIAAAKAQPGKLSYATGAATGTVAGEALKRQAGVDILQVPYKSNPPAITDVVAGRVSMTFTDVTSGLAQIKAGKLKPLAVTMKARTPLMPELPTMAEAGGGEFDMYGWGAIFAPAGTPPEIVQRLSGEVVRILNQPETRDRIMGLGLDVAPLGASELGAFLRAELAKWERLVRDAGIQPE
jgi:tripartite-type tricarboxylate transporter receptor subunit TctC